jgi:hypothetical protein
LQEIGGITPVEALEKYGCFRLAARIEELRKQGHQIVTRTIQRGEKEFAQYNLVRKA